MRNTIFLNTKVIRYQSSNPLDLATHKEALVGDLWDSTREGGCSSCFTRSFNDWEMEVKNFLHIIQPMKVIPSLEDKLILKESKAGSYSVKFMYEFLNQSPNVPFLFQSMWNPLVPLKVGFFAWEALWGKVLTLHQLKRWGRILANKCYLC